MNDWVQDPAWAGKPVRAKPDLRTDDEHMADVAGATIKRLTDLDPELSLLTQQLDLLAAWANRKHMPAVMRSLNRMQAETEWLQEQGVDAARRVLDSCDDQRPRAPRDLLYQTATGLGWVRTVESPIFDRYQYIASDGILLRIDLGWTVDELTSATWHEKAGALTVREGDVLGEAIEWMQQREHV